MTAKKLSKIVTLPREPGKPCFVCAESIKAAAKKCTKCGSYQDWRRYLEISQPWIPWLVTVVTAIFAVANYFSQIVHLPDSNLELSSPHVFNDEARFIVVNSGDRPGVIEQMSVRLSLKDASGRGYFFQSDHAIPSGQPDIIKPGEQLSYRLTLTDRPIGVEYTDVSGLRKVLHQSDALMQDGSGNCRFEIVVRNYRSRRNHIDSPISCYDIRTYVNNYIARAETRSLQQNKGARP